MNRRAFMASLAGTVAAKPFTIQLTEADAASHANSLSALVVMYKEYLLYGTVPECMRPHYRPFSVRYFQTVPIGYWLRGKST